MMDMLMQNATDVRREWSRVVDGVVRDKPAFIKRTRDKMWLSNIETIKEILEIYQFTAKREREQDGSITLVLNEIDLIENASTEMEARKKLGEAILEYSVDYYREYAYWSSAPNRKKHIPYIFKALIIDNAVQLGESIICQDGKN